MSHVVGWLSNRLRPYGGWAIFLLVLVALLCLPASLDVAIDQSRGTGPLLAFAPEAHVLPALTILAALLGLEVARRRVPGARAGVVCLLSGFTLVVLAVERLLPPWSLLWPSLQDAFSWPHLAQQSLRGWPPPLFSLSTVFSERLDRFGAALLWDVRSVVGGVPVWETTASVLLSALLLWVLAFYGSWRIYRRRSPLLALLPSGAVLASLAYRYPSTTLYLFIFLFCALWLMAACHLWAKSERWRSERIDHPGQLGLELVFVVAPWILMLLLLAGVFPTKGFGQVSRAFWSKAETVFGPFEDRVQTPMSGAGSLPQHHLVSSGPQLADIIVMYVRTNDPIPPKRSENPSQAPMQAVRRYWRGDNYDIYTGRGWLGSPTEPINVPAKGLFDVRFGSGPDLLQRFELHTNGPVIYAANAPQQVDHAVTGWWRSPGDLGRLTGDTKSYTVISRPPESDVSRLKAGQGVLPVGFAGRYLDLPETIPQRVLDLSGKVVGVAATQYDKTLAIETFLRAYPYNLDLPPPPVDRDLVDYFLFDLQEGYCDYYASAMVVMARAAGFPARLATGYAQGEYDHDLERWVVTEQDAHSWVEVYFSGVGWVDFEPTAGRPALNRAGDSEHNRPDVPALPLRPIPWHQGVSSHFFWLVFAGLLACAGICAATILNRRTSLESSDVVRDRYRRLLRWGARLGTPPWTGQTPQEYALSLTSSLHSRSKGARWSRVHRARRNAPLAVEVLTQSFILSQYSTKPLTTSQVAAVRSLWTDLRRDLFWLWLHRP